MMNKDIHRTILVKILKDIFTDSLLGQHLGFKGGTAAYLFYDLSRFSVDLDFDLLTKEEEDTVFFRVKTILEKYGILKTITKKRYSLFYLLSYQEKIPGASNIKIEINKRNFGSRYEIKQYLGIPMKVMRKEDMFANKLVAMWERIGKANRDIFDVWYFLEKDWSINKTIVETRTELNFDTFLKKCIAALEALPDRNILSGVGELLTDQQRKWVKTQLRKETIFLLRLKFDVR